MNAPYVIMFYPADDDPGATTYFPEIRDDVNDAIAVAKDALSWPGVHSATVFTGIIEDDTTVPDEPVYDTEG